MAQRRAASVSLTKEAKSELESLVKRHKVGQQVALRGRVVLACGEGKSNRAIAKAEGVTIKLVSRWRQRWLTLAPIPFSELSVADRLEDLPRSGAPARITADQVCQIVALACEKPSESARPISQWTGREIADEVKKRNIVEQISPRHAGRLLKRSIDQTSSDSLLAHASTG
jgi:transposase